MSTTQCRTSTEKQLDQNSIPMGQHAESTGHVLKTPTSLQEIGPSTAELADPNNGQTPPTTVMDAAVTHTHVKPQQAVFPTHQQTPNASADKDTSATEAGTMEIPQLADTKKQELMAGDKDKQHHPSQTPAATTRDPGDKETQTRIAQTDAAIQTDSPPQAER